MSLFKRLFKPAWQHSDAGRRATAVQSLRDADLVSALPTIATQDGDASVRRTAMLRMNDLGLYADRSRHDADDKLRSDARKRFVNGLLAADDERLAEAERLLRVEEDLSVMESVARGAKQSALRRLALEKLSRPGLLADCALSDADAGIRLWLVDRIDAESALKRVIDQSRKTDKRVYRAASARLEQRALDSGDGKAQKQHALDLCTRLEALLHELPADAKSQLAEVRTDWASNGAALDDAIKIRVEGLIGALDDALRAIDAEPEPAQAEQESSAEADPEPSAEADPAAEAEQEPEPAPQAEPEPTPEPAPEPAIDPRLSALHAELAEAAGSDEADLDGLSTRATELSQELELEERDATNLQRSVRKAQTARRERARDAVEAHARKLIEQLKQSTENQQAMDARAALTALEAIREEHQGLPRPLRAAFSEAKADARKLLDWQSWSNNEIRRRLCADVEAIPEAGLHPDAVAARIKELQIEWRRLDAVEGIDSKAPARGLAKRFNAIVFQVLKPARPYFEKRAELRRERGEALEQSTSSIEAQLAQAKDRKAIMSLRKSLVDSLRELNDIDPRQRKSMGLRLRADLTAVDTRLNEQTEQVELAKRRMIAELRRDLSALPAEEHADRAKQAQSRWRGLGIGERKRDQAQWKELRELVDPVFEAVAGQRQVEQAENRVQADAVAALTTKLKNAADDEQCNADALRRLQQQVRDELAELGPLDRQLERQIDEALNRVDQCTADRVRLERLSTYTALATRANRLDRIEAAWIDGSGLDKDALHQLIEAEPLSDAALQASLTVRRQRLVDLSGESDEADVAQVLNLLEVQQREAETLLLDCEFFAGADSPEAFKSERMNLQVKRLAERMSGGEASHAGEQAAQLWADWFAVGPLSASSRETLAARFQKCREALETALK